MDQLEAFIKENMNAKSEIKNEAEETKDVEVKEVQSLLDISPSKAELFFHNLSMDGRRCFKRLSPWSSDII